MGNCLRGNPDDFEVSESSLHQHRSSSRNRRYASQGQQQQQQQQTQQQQTQNCRHGRTGQPGSAPAAAAAATTEQAGAASHSTTAAAAAAATAGAGKNQPLRRERIRWTCDHPMTGGQLAAKREEFWDTAPAFDGRPEIWQALRAAAAALESGDHELAQAILNGAGVTLPRGLLTDSYDELGTRYQLPLYVLTAPANLAAESPPGSATAADDQSPDLLAVEASPDSQQTAASAAAAPATVATLKLRLSTGGRDIRMPVPSGDTVAKAKAQLARLNVGGLPVGAKQRWYCYGRQLTDRMRICECPIPRGFVVQVVLLPQPQTDATDCEPAAVT